MNKHNFKIGDKVKVFQPNHWRQGDKIGKVVCLCPPYIRVSWEGYRGTLYAPSEIYKAYVKGEQLMLFEL